MTYGDFENLLRSMVNNEFRKRDSELHEDIEKQFSKLAAEGLLPSGVAVTRTTELCMQDLTERIKFSYEKIKVIIDSKNISYTDDLKTKAEKLFEEFTEDAKCNSFSICTEAVDKINTGSVEGSLNRIKHKYQIEQKEYLNEIEVYFDELKNKTVTKWVWLKQQLAKLFWYIITVFITVIVTAIVARYI